MVLATKDEIEKAKKALNDEWYPLIDKTNGMKDIVYDQLYQNGQ